MNTMPVLRKKVMLRALRAAGYTVHRRDVPLANVRDCYQALMSGEPDAPVPASAAAAVATPPAIQRPVEKKRTPAKPAVPSIRHRNRVPSHAELLELLCA